MREVTARGQNLLPGWGHEAHECLSYPFKWKVVGGSGCLQPAPWEVWQGGGESGMPVSTGKLAIDSRYYSPEPLVLLLGCVNESRVLVKGMQMIALVNTRSQISALTEGFCTEMGLRIFPLGNLMKGVLHLEGMKMLPYHFKG